MPEEGQYKAGVYYELLTEPANGGDLHCKSRAGSDALKKAPYIVRAPFSLFGAEGGT